MPGNELVVSKYLFENLNQLQHPALGVFTTLANPTLNGLEPITDLISLQRVSSDSSLKKADIVLNNYGISIKQTGGSILYNRLQLDGLYELFLHLGISDPAAKINHFNSVISDFHNGQPTIYLGRNYTTRNKPWQLFFNEEDFKKLLFYLTMIGSLKTGDSFAPADFILEAPSAISRPEDLVFYNFDEYFDTYKDNNIFIAVRRCWYGQGSTSEHNRASSLISNPNNAAWVFDTISGSPRTWNPNIPEHERKTVYYCSIEKI